MHDSKSLVKKATRKAFAGSIQEGSNLLRNFHSLLSIPKRKRDLETWKQERNSAGNNTDSSSHVSHEDSPDESCQQSESQSEFGTQLMLVNSSDSCSSYEGSNSCVSPVVGQHFCQKESSAHIRTFVNVQNSKKSQFSSKYDKANCSSSTLSVQTISEKPVLPSPPWNASSLTLGREDELLLARSRGLRRQPSGFKKDHVFHPPPKNKLRRIHSMYASKTEVSADYRNAEIEPEEESSATQGRVYDSYLPASGISHYYSESSDDNLPRIQVDTLVRILNGSFQDHYDKIHLVDCRFEYEFQGGHIQGAINISSQKDLESEFIYKRSEHCKGDKPPLVIFHCEFSSYRCPIIASHLRSCDRVLNYDTYPKLYYPDILILEGGYKTFFERCSYLCFPRRYVGMNSEEHVDKCETEMEKFRRDVKRVVTRANSFHVLNKSSSSGPVPTVGRLKSRSQSQFQMKKKSHNEDSSHNIAESSLSFRYEAPPKLSLSRCSVGSSSPSSSTASSRLLLEDELEGEFGSPLLDDVSDTEARAMFRGCDDSDSILTMDGVKRSLFQSILKEEDHESPFGHAE
ncbi:LAFE_0F06920g1_1 [Lachancea fermentati]|uniref:M-phase inducer phosphatase n=1 Tax=Lachancea fermentati TaxID=4955 RepID=A0A1G4MEX8_LACFM|nr:LAFE_0F06920g1_1 [Lachancea fermentati]